MARLNIIDPQNTTLDSLGERIAETISVARSHAHEALERGDYHQVKTLTDCIRALERAAAVIRPRVWRCD